MGAGVRIAQPTSVPPLPTDWRERLRRSLRSTPEHRLELCRFGGVSNRMPAPVLAQLRAELPRTLRAAAVLIAIVEREEPSVLLTVRASHLRHHAGQISFPGGRLEAQDSDPTAAALRETQEEIGVAAESVTPVGFLADHVLRTGFRITPVVALLQPGFILAPDSTEVAEVFELPLAFALAAANYRVQQRSVAHLQVEVWELPFGEHHIWGATAGMLAHLRDVIAEGQAA